MGCYQGPKLAVASRRLRPKYCAGELKCSWASPWASRRKCHFNQICLQCLRTSVSVSTQGVVTFFSDVEMRVPLLTMYPQTRACACQCLFTLIRSARKLKVVASLRTIPSSERYQNARTPARGFSFRLFCSGEEIGLTQNLGLNMERFLIRHPAKKDNVRQLPLPTECMFCSYHINSVHGDVYTVLDSFSKRVIYYSGLNHVTEKYFLVTK